MNKRIFVFLVLVFSLTGETIQLFFKDPLEQLESLKGIIQNLSSKDNEKINKSDKEGLKQIEINPVDIYNYDPKEIYSIKSISSEIPGNDQKKSDLIHYEDFNSGPEAFNSRELKSYQLYKIDPNYQMKENNNLENKLSVDNIYKSSEQLTDRRETNQVKSFLNKINKRDLHKINNEHHNFKNKGDDEKVVEVDMGKGHIKFERCNQHKSQNKEYANENYNDIENDENENYYEDYNHDSEKLKSKKQCKKSKTLRSMKNNQNYDNYDIYEEINDKYSKYEDDEYTNKNSYKQIIGEKVEEVEPEYKYKQKNKQSAKWELDHNSDDYHDYNYDIRRNKKFKTSFDKDQMEEERSDSNKYIKDQEYFKDHYSGNYGKEQYFTYIFPNQDKYDDESDEDNFKTYSYSHRDSHSDYDD
jgi:hypothetical protein